MGTSGLRGHSTRGTVRSEVRQPVLIIKYRGLDPGGHMAFPGDSCQLEEMATWSYALGRSSIPGNALDLNRYSGFNKQMQEEFKLSFVQKHWF